MPLLVALVWFGLVWLSVWCFLDDNLQVEIETMQEMQGLFAGPSCICTILCTLFAGRSCIGRAFGCLFAGEPDHCPSFLENSG